MCYTKKIIEGGADKSISAEIQVPGESPWFNGHFPGKPILPGVAQLAVVTDLLGEALGHPVTVTQVSRVRFKQTVQPGQPVTIHITPKDDPLSFGFHIENGAEPVCSGNIRIAHRVPAGKTTDAGMIGPGPEPKKES